MLTITRIAVGDGGMPDGTNPAELTGLIHEVARPQATCSVPFVESDTLSLEIEYRNKWDDGTFGEGYTDPTGLTESFWLQEYAIFALDADGNEIMLYYANLGDFPEPVAKWNGRNLVSKFYPVSISIVDDETEVELLFPANAFITAEYFAERLANLDMGYFDGDEPLTARELITVHNGDALAHQNLLVDGDSGAHQNLNVDGSGA
jgi:hypothetical protein